MSDTTESMISTLEKQRAATRGESKPDAATRKDRIARLIDMLISNQDEIIATERKDFQNKSPVLIRLAEVMGTVNALRFVQSKIDEWMSPEKIELPADFEALGLKAEIQFQPLGTVGVIAPWNGPIILTCMPLAGILAAGNRAMIKPSEFAPHTADLLAKLIAENFDDSEIAVFCGGSDVASAFTHLPFDHLLYTGSTRIAKKVMAAAAENLVPVTLELGGKCPVIIGEDADLDIAADRLAYGKLFHGGQVCVTPDYLFIPEANAREFSQKLVASAETIYPSIIGNEDYSPIVNAHHYRRLQALVDDAQEKGAEVICVNPADESIDIDQSLRFPMHLILDPSDQMDVMNEEIFGPIFPIKTYCEIDEAIDYIENRPHPLSAYYFGTDPANQQMICDRITTGSIVLNDVVCQIFYEEIPFGGVGTSGIGRYRGHEGFKTFSNPVSVLTQMENEEILKSLRPPYGEGIQAFINQQLGQNQT